MTKITFDFKDNPEKTITAGTMKTYKQKLNVLSRSVLDVSGNPLIKKSEDILIHADAVASYLKTITNTQGKNLMLASIFYAIGRQDFVKDPRGLPIFHAFQENYKYKTKE